MIIGRSNPGLFETLNARFLEPEQVASTFVPPSTFKILARRAHTIVVGPRGSGKTTLLKMLQERALDTWKHPEARSYRSSIDFIGVFVASDIGWAEQVNSLSDSGWPSPLQEKLNIATFTVHVLRALVSSMHYRIHGNNSGMQKRQRRPGLPESVEREFVAHLREVWHVDPRMGTLISLKHGLTTCLARIGEVGRRGPGPRLDESLPFMNIHFLPSVVAAIETFNDIVPSAPRKWALCFDELELVPPWIRKTILQALRSTDERLLFKLSMSPHNEDAREFVGTLSARPRHDFDLIPLWYADREDSEVFCRSLFGEMLQERDLRDTTAEHLLGPSPFDPVPLDDERWRQYFRKHPNLIKQFIQLSQRDPSFRNFLAEERIDPTRIVSLSAKSRRSLIRGIAPIVAVRTGFRTTRRPRKPDFYPSFLGTEGHTQYSGAQSIFALVEGNPRWFKGIIGALLEAHGNKKRAVSPTIQARTIGDASQEFCAMLSTVECALPNSKTRSDGLLGLLDRIGYYFFRQAVIENFDPTPPACIVVDDYVSDEIETSVARALNAGGVVYIPGRKDQAILDSTRKKRFRLSYLLAPRYQIPLRSGGEVELSRLERQLRLEDL